MAVRQPPGQRHGALQVVSVLRSQEGEAGATPSSPGDDLAPRAGTLTTLMQSMNSMDEDDISLSENRRKRGLETMPRAASVDDEDTPESLSDISRAPDLPSFTWLSGQRDIITLSYAILVGGLVATSVFVFDVSIQYIHDIPDMLANKGIGGGRATGLAFGDVSVPFRCVMPIGAGVLVAWLQGMGFAPPLKVVAKAVDTVQDDIKNASLPQGYGQVRW
jgi:hypothetical protein